MAAINDATLQKVGDLYQYFIALLDCFSLKKGEAMLIETQGDVSIISFCGKSRLQKEIKHHFGSKYLSNRSEDFWKTLDTGVKNEKAWTLLRDLFFALHRVYQANQYSVTGIKKLQVKDMKY